MNYPVLGVYITEDQQYKFQIDSANSDNGRIGGGYEAVKSPAGSFITKSDDIGHYSWVNNKQTGKSGQPPFCIAITANYRPDGRPFCIFDYWAGAYTTDKLFLAQGSRSYVNEEGKLFTEDLGEHKFILS